jgi:hypothetical protein
MNEPIASPYPYILSEIAAREIAQQMEDVREKDKEIERLKSLILLAFKHGIETACDFYDNGMPKRIGDQAYAKWAAENGISQ